MKAPLLTSILTHLSHWGSLVLACLMSWRDIRCREVRDAELALLAALTLLPRSLAGTVSPSAPSFPPLWFRQLWDLVLGSTGALFLLLVYLAIRLFRGQELLGLGDVLFTLAMGFALPGGPSLSMVCLAFLLVLPFALILKLLPRKQTDLPFIPFLTLAAFMVHWLPLPDPFRF